MTTIKQSQTFVVTKEIEYPLRDNTEFEVCWSFGGRNKPSKERERYQTLLHRTSLNRQNPFSPI